MNRISPVVSVYDRTAQVFRPPFIVENTAVAIRGFMDAINRSGTDNDIANYPDDFEIYEIGTFDSFTGLIEPINPLGKPVITGSQAKIRASGSEA